MSIASCRVCWSMTGYLRTFGRWLIWMKSLLSLCLCFSVCVCVVVAVVCVCHCVFVCRSPTPFSRATQPRHCGGSSVWAMPSCFVPSSSSWGACFSWPLPCFSWMTGRRPRNSKWLRQCLNNSSLFHLLFSHSFFKYLRLAWDVLRWLSELHKSKHITSVQEAGEAAIILVLFWVPYKYKEVRHGNNYILFNPVVGVWSVSGTSCPVMPTMELR